MAHGLGFVPRDEVREDSSVLSRKPLAMLRPRPVDQDSTNQRELITTESANTEARARRH
jgi:hypothetical protein